MKQVTLMPLRKGTTPRTMALAAVACAALAAPTAASASTLSQNLTCTAQTVSSPLAKWGDMASYWLAPGGDFETGATGWTLSNARVAPGNETFGVVPGKNSLQLAGQGLNIATATTPEFCVDPTHPMFRFLVKNSSPTAVLNTYINFRSASGTKLTVPAKLNTFTFGQWTLSTTQPLATTIPALFLGSGTTASITFKAVTATLTSTISIDDVLIDPYRRG